MYPHARLMTVSLCMCLGGLQAMAQKPVTWRFSAVKVDAGTYLVHLTARIDPGWHVYSQTQPESAVALPTKIQFTANPLVVLSGKPGEVGQVVHWSDAASGLAANQYQNKVDFVQKVTVKGNIKVNVTGNLTFQVCTDEMCLPPETIPFSVPL